MLIKGVWRGFDCVGDAPAVAAFTGEAIAIELVRLILLSAFSIYSKSISTRITDQRGGLTEASCLPDTVRLALTMSICTSSDRMR